MDERLCEEVRRYPHLYNSTLKQYKDSQMCSNSWREIARTMKQEESVCRQKWKYLRDRYVKAKKRLKKRSAAAGGNVPPIVTLLDWLSDFVKHRDADSNFPVEEEAVPQPRRSWRLATLVMHKTRRPQGAPQHSRRSQQSHSHQSAAPPQHSQESAVPPTASQESKYHPTAIEDAILHRLQQIDRAKDSHSEEHRFGIMVADMLAKLPARERMEAQFEIHQLLYLKQKEVYEKDFSQ